MVEVDVYHIKRTSVFTRIKHHKSVFLHDHEDSTKTAFVLAGVSNKDHLTIWNADHANMVGDQRENEEDNYVNEVKEVCGIIVLIILNESSHSNVFYVSHMHSHRQSNMFT